MPPFKAIFKLFTSLLLLTSLGVTVFVLLPPKTAFASTTNGTLSGYAWSSQIGWINFGTTNGNTHITDTAVTGYAWNENTGRINLNPTHSGIQNNSNGTLSGKAWSEGTGWIDFGGVTVSSTGVFSGTATGDNSVSITFNCTHCNVTTDWRPANSRTTTSTSTSSTGGGVFGPPSSVANSISINHSSGYTNSRVIVLSLNGGPDAYTMAISNSPDFTGAVKEDYQKTKAWILPQGDGVKTVYVTFYSKYDVPAQAPSSSIVLDTVSPAITITSIQNIYTPNEDVIIGGTTESNAQITAVIDSKYGILNSDQTGVWLVNLGKLYPGNHHVELTAKDLAGNTGATISADFSVIQTNQNPAQFNLPFNLPSPFTLAPPLAPILRQLAQGVTSLLPKFFQPIEKNVPQVLVTVPKIAPIAFKGSFHYLSTKALSTFVLAPLPADIKLLAQKFPQVQKTFSEVGVQKITDVQKLANANLKLPTLTESVLPQAPLATGGFSVLKGIPVSNLTSTAKSKIPSAIVFAKAAGGLVDFNVALSINGQGKTEQAIETIAGHPLQLVVKADRPVKRVRGYIIFKSKKYKQSSFQVPLNDMAASLLFANPNLAVVVKPSVSVQVEGNNNGPSLEAQVVPQKAAPAEVKNSAGIEQRLVLTQFEYTDNGDGVYTANVQAPLVDAEYEIITVMEYEDPGIESKEIKLVTVVDPEGYVYEKNGDLETRIAGSIVSLYWLNPDSNQYELWPAKDFQQENPQTTDVRGTYSFLVPNGYYYLKVDAPGYLSYDGKPFEVKEGSGVHVNIELKTKYWFLNVVDWKTLLLVVVILLLIYNFYKDRIRERRRMNI